MQGGRSRWWLAASPDRPVPLRTLLLAKKVPNGVEYELKKLYYEIAGSANRPAMSALMNLVPISQIIFGSDYPWGSTGANATDLTISGSPPPTWGHQPRERDSVVPALQDVGQLVTGWLRDSRITLA